MSVLEDVLAVDNEPTLIDAQPVLTEIVDKIEIRPPQDASLFEL